MLCNGINGDLGDLKGDIRAFRTENDASHVRLHTRIDDLANRKVVSYGIAALMSALVAIAVASLTIMLTRL